LAAFVVKRLGWAVVLAFLITFITFVLFFIVPDEAKVARSSNQDQLISLARQYDVEGQSIFEQYGHFVWRFVSQGDLGESFISHQAVMEKLAAALPVTAALIFGGMILWLMIAFPIGILSALRPRSLLDRFTMIFVLVGVSAHPVWIGLILSYVLGFKLGITPIAGYCDFFNPVLACGGALDWAYHMLLPWLTFALLFAALYTRMIRAMVLETLQEDYVRTAQAKGAGPARVIRSHVLRNAMLPIVTMLGMDIGLALGGAIFTETVYSLPGLGRTSVQALNNYDVPTVMGVIVFSTIIIIVFNLIVDVLYAVIDPRIRLA
jgi:peptide/nickel transport system permease protein